jgi:hypothetical protein
VLTPRERLYYVVAAYDSAHFFIVPEDMKKYFPATLTKGDTVKAVDKFFETPENIPIPIMHAFRVIAMRSEGATVELVDKEISALRHAAAASARESR